MSFSLDSGKLRESFRKPMPVLWGAIVNLGLLPLLTWPLALSHSLADFSLGLIIAAAVPCTLATASVSTRQAGGNDAVSLLVTLFTNVVGIVLTPLWLRWSASASVAIDPGPIISNLTLSVLLPTIAGQLLRYAPVVGTFARNQKSRIGILAQCLVLLIITKAAIEAGGRLQNQEVWPSLVEFVQLTFECAGLHAMAICAAYQGGKWLGLTREDAIATMFSGSQKTLPIGLLLAAMPAVSGDKILPFLTFPILLFHAVQLLMDTAVANKIARSNAQSGEVSSETTEGKHAVIK